MQDRSAPEVMRLRRGVLFALFFVSGACGLLYQVVWLRLAFAAFGVITPVLSVVIAVFMLGLAVGSWGAGRWVSDWSRKTGLSAIYCYAAAEIVVGISAFVVPGAFRQGQTWLLPMGESDSFAYLLYSAIILAASILPACIAMGTTYPLMLAYVKEIARDDDGSFSFLYTANVVGAAAGTLLTAVVLVEVFGFRATLLVAGLANFSIAAVALWLGGQLRRSSSMVAPTVVEPAAMTAAPAQLSLLLLFTTGFCSLGLEVMWTRAFTPVIGTEVYAFAMLLFVYLLATMAGSWLYRLHLASDRVVAIEWLVGALVPAVLVPVLLNDPRLHNTPIIALLSIAPFSAMLGYLTPRLVDEYSRGFPQRAGGAYAINVLGSILGPLCAGYLILPSLGTRHGMVLLCLPVLLLLVLLWHRQRPTVAWAVGIGTTNVALLLGAVFFSISHEEGPPDQDVVVRRDHTATVLSLGQGVTKQLLVNGTGITNFTPITKIMAHMPLMVHPSPKSAAVICFGMGTTFRSSMSWGVNVSAVELVSSVRDAFGFYFDDAPMLLKSMHGNIIIDDGRRFLQRTDQRFDVITIDPPPPVEAAGSSLLYSKDFLEIVRGRLAAGGILHHWLPANAGFDLKTLHAVSRSIVETFPHVRAFESIEGWGIHYLASMAPIDIPSEGALIARMPARARRDLKEWVWSDEDNVATFVRGMFRTEINVASLLGDDPDVVITDDRPFNEYYLLRRWLQ